MTFARRIKRVLDLLGSVINFLKAVVDFFDRDHDDDKPKDPSE